MVTAGDVEALLRLLPREAFAELHARHVASREEAADRQRASREAQRHASGLDLGEEWCGGFDGGEEGGGGRLGAWEVGSDGADSPAGARGGIPQAAGHAQAVDLQPRAQLWPLAWLPLASQQ